MNCLEPKVFLKHFSWNSKLEKDIPWRVVRLSLEFHLAQIKIQISQTFSALELLVHVYCNDILAGDFFGDLIVRTNELRVSEESHHSLVVVFSLIYSECHWQLLKESRSELLELLRTQERELLLVILIELHASYLVLDLLVLSLSILIFGFVLLSWVLGPELEFLLLFFVLSVLVLLPLAESLLVLFVFALSILMFGLS